LLRALLLVAGFAASTPVARTVTPVALSPDHAALVTELHHITARLGPEIWSDWRTEDAPMILRTGTHEILFAHPAPPSDFQRFYSNVLGDSLWIRPAPDERRLQAAFPIEGHVTAVISAPADDEDPCIWVLLAAHELFHVYTGLARVVNPFQGPHEGTHDLSFPYPYDDEALNASIRLEGESVFLLATGDTTAQSVQRRLLPLAWRVQRALAADSLFIDYKQLQEWNEGVARYTERELARLARDPEAYTATDAFRERFPDATYAHAWDERYENMLAPIRFAGDGVRQRAMFYYLGMGKAYALDRLEPGWKSRYRGTTLDELLSPGD